MNKVSKRLLALALSLTMVAGLVPASLAADETEAVSTPSISLTFTAAKGEDDAKLTITKENATDLDVMYDGKVTTETEITVTEAGVYTVELWTKKVDASGEGESATPEVPAKKVASASKTIVEITFTVGKSIPSDVTLSEEIEDGIFLLEANTTWPEDFWPDKLTLPGYIQLGWDKEPGEKVPSVDTTYTTTWKALPEWTVTLSSQTSGKLAALTFNAENAETVDLSKLVAEAYLGDAEPETITFGLPEDTKVASITDSTLTATGAGSTTLTITVAEAEGVARETVKTVPVVVAKAEREATASLKTEDTIYVGDVREITIEDNASNDKPTYTATSSDTKVVTATVADGEVKLTAVGAGEATVTVKAPATNNYKAAEDMTVKVAVTAIATPVITVKTGEGDAAVEVSSISATFGDDPISIAATAAYTAEGASEATNIESGIAMASSDENVAKIENSKLTFVGAGTATITVTVDKATAEGENAPAYGAATKEITVNVAKKTLTIAGATVTNTRAYDGTKAVEVTAVTFANDVTLAADGNYTMAGEVADPNVGENKDVTVTVTLTEAAAKNYTLTSNKFVVEKATAITKAETVPTTWGTKAEVTVKAGAGNVDLSSILADIPGAAIKTVTDKAESNSSIFTAESIKVGTDKKSVDFTVDSDAEDDAIGTISVTVENTNYKDHAIEVTVNVTTKDIPVLTLNDYSKVFDGDAVDPNTIAKANVAGTFTWTTEGTEVKDVQEKTQMQVTFTPNAANTDKYATVKGYINVTITAKPLNVTVNFDKEDGEWAVNDTIPTIDADTAITDNTTAPKAAKLVFAWGDDITAGTTTIEEGKAYAYTVTAQDSDGNADSNYAVFTGEKVFVGKASSKPSGSGSSWLGNITSTTTDSKTGAVTETSTKPDGTKVAVTTETDGTVTTTETYTDGTVAATTVKDGAITSTVTVPASVDKVTLTIPTPEAATAGMVAVIVKADGTEEIVKTSIPGENGVALTLTESAELKIVDNSKDFVDLAEDHWAAASIDFVTAREIFNGTGDGNFSPAANTTRASLMTILARLNGVDTEGGATWYEKGMAWAVENGVSDGTDPDGNITREQLVTMLYRYVGEPETTTNLSAFNDAEAVSDWAVSAMTWAVSNGIVTGKDNSMLDPTGLATRAEVATMLERYVKLTAKA